MSTSPLPRCQVFCFGHSLSASTQLWLNQNYPGGVRVFRAHYHADKMSDAVRAADGVLSNLARQGADLDNHVRTIIVSPGMSAGALLLAAGWMGMTGDLPKVLNLMRVGDEYVPSPELPLLDLMSFKNNVGRKKRSGQYVRPQGAERSECPRSQPQRAVYDVLDATEVQLDLAA